MTAARRSGGVVYTQDYQEVSTMGENNNAGADLSGLAGAGWCAKRLYAALTGRYAITRFGRN